MADKYAKAYDEMEKAQHEILAAEEICGDDAVWTHDALRQAYFEVMTPRKVKSLIKLLYQEAIAGKPALAKSLLERLDRNIEIEAERRKKAKAPKVAAEPVVTAEDVEVGEADDEAQEQINSLMDHLSGLGGTDAK